MPNRPPIAGAKRHNSWDHGGKSRHERGYGSKWDRLRRLVLARDKHLCQDCWPQKVTPATQVDHVVAKAKGGTDDPANLRALCRPCHDRKTIKDKGHVARRTRRATGADGWPIDD